ncbi:glycosyl hydrolase family 79 C-terminal domain-containing protein [Pedococcus sp. 5OH_020]|uniref:glycosyl hydrolase family 79 C-terminal domain-containing protein n=1 Tax=Pedococcus sp. 5OH_020 TaxID=2989814 RepID=UPI0022E9AF87|nr:glycosyl hydrolase family 79 C-terminal domain-containing protein [Pedococcus sp. 5OH_020]
MSDTSTTVTRRGRSRRGLRRSVLATAAVAGIALAAGTGAVGSTTTGAGASTAFTLTATKNDQNPRITGDNQGFSVESADFAHGFLTKALLSQRLKTLGRHGVVRLGGYSMDLVWPAFGRYSSTAAPPEAIGGTVDQADLDGLKALLDDSGWKVTLGVPLKKLLDPSQVKSPTKDPSPAVTIDQVVAEVKAAHDTLGDDLLSVELGNEFDNVSTLTGAEYYTKLKEVAAELRAGVPGVDLKLTGPSANTSTANTRLDQFVTAVAADTSSDPRRLLSEITSHWYPGSHCGSSNVSIPTLMSASTWTKTQTKLDGVMALQDRLSHPVPMVVNESNSASCSGQPGVSDSYATSLWSLDYLLQAAKAGIGRVALHTNTKAICGDFKERSSADYPVSYRYYGAFCAKDQAELDQDKVSPTPLYYGLWAFRQVPEGGRFLDLDLPTSALPQLRAYAVEGPQGTVTAVLVNVQDPTSLTSTADAVTLTLPSTFQKAEQVTLKSDAPGGLSSTDASAISLGGRQVLANGAADGVPTSVPADVQQKSATVTVPAGTASIVTFSHDE